MSANTLYSRHKIVQALEVIRVKNSYLIQFDGINTFQAMIFRLFTVYHKHEMVKIGNKT